MHDQSVGVGNQDPAPAAPHAFEARVLERPRHPLNVEVLDPAGPGRAVMVLEFHYRTEDDWKEFLARPRTGAVEADPAVLAGALAALSREDAVIVAREETLFGACDRPAGGARDAGRKPR